MDESQVFAKTRKGTGEASAQGFVRAMRRR